ncbi:MAG: hypothetical protein KTR31_05305 [Myxococcales bacterium]|nr:hypothetical protein [Myxococcales bacterium]
MAVWNASRDVIARARRRVKRVAQRSDDRIWGWRTEALEQAGQFLDRASDVPTIGAIFEPAQQLVEQQLERITEVPVDNWDDLNAKRAAAAVRQLDRAGLRNALRREQQTKSRKTVLKAIEERLARQPRLAPRPVASAPA